jgi:hypothetical protein
LSRDGRARRNWPGVGAFSALAAGLAKSAQQRAVEVSERRGLDAIGKQAQQQPAWQMGGRKPAQTVDFH